MTEEKKSLFPITSGTTFIILKSVKEMFITSNDHVSV